MSTEHLQHHEVVSKLGDMPEGIAIVHLDSKREVSISSDGDGSWDVVGSGKLAPDKAAKALLKKLKVKVSKEEIAPRFGPGAGQVFVVYRMLGTFQSAEAAATAALAIHTVAWKLPETDWLWVTTSEYDDRDDPKPPKVWPPKTKGK